MPGTQIYLERDLIAALDRLARKRGTSRANVIRLATRQFVAQDDMAAPGWILELAGTGHGGPGDVSERHDDHLIEAELSSGRCDGRRVA